MTLKSFFKCTQGTFKVQPSLPKCPYNGDCFPQGNRGHRATTMLLDRAGSAGLCGARNCSGSLAGGPARLSRRVGWGCTPDPGPHWGLLVSPLFPRWEAPQQTGFHSLRQRKGVLRPRHFPSGLGYCWTTGVASLAAQLTGHTAATGRSMAVEREMPASGSWSTWVDESGSTIEKDLFPLKMAWFK